jgi:hypothetical protein
MGKEVCCMRRDSSETGMRGSVASCGEARMHGIDEREIACGGSGLCCCCQC